MRHCNTLPLSLNFKTMEKFITAVNEKEMLDKSYEAWKAVYEETYKKKLTYTCVRRDFFSIEAVQ